MSAVRLLPWVLHEAIEYAAGVFLILAPFLFGFKDDGAPTAMFLLTGLLVLVVAVVSRGSLAVTQTLPAQVHATLDYVLAAFLVLAPFLFRFTDTKPALYSSVLLGLAHFAVTVTTQFPTTETADR